jgi:hypothetical protein
MQRRSFLKSLAAASGFAVSARLGEAALPAAKITRAITAAHCPMSAE